jgi:hypothetical protein
VPKRYNDGKIELAPRFGARRMNVPQTLSSTSTHCELNRRAQRSFMHIDVSVVDDYITEIPGLERARRADPPTDASGRDTGAMSWFPI